MSAQYLIPGQVILAAEDIELNPGQPLLTVEVANNGDRPVELGSHYHIAEANPALEFNREATRGYRLAIPAGTSLRLEPGQRRMLDLIPFGGTRELFGFRGEVMGPLDAPPVAEESASAQQGVNASA
ncbi:Urease subunit beta [Thiorhodovibrio winogradskyi]|uniref:Urease subunit beta n=1 Tax=Thiorhodovibrio winogradskyi TaxID=77007 RepID=A0ABZ0SD02_9GAMM|nr:urease subunit beta [Thiorhodovibrio winogradskyi]